jgi:hypothetical protein
MAREIGYLFVVHVLLFCTYTLLCINIYMSAYTHLFRRPWTDNSVFRRTHIHTHTYIYMRFTSCRVVSIWINIFSTKIPTGKYRSARVYATRNVQLCAGCVYLKYASVCLGQKKFKKISTPPGHPRRRVWNNCVFDQYTRTDSTAVFENFTIQRHRSEHI